MRASFLDRTPNQKKGLYAFWQGVGKCKGTYSLGHRAYSKASRRGNSPGTQGFHAAALPLCHWQTGCIRTGVQSVPVYSHRFSTEGSSGLPLSSFATGRLVFSNFARNGMYEDGGARRASSASNGLFDPAPLVCKTHGTVPVRRNMNLPLGSCSRSLMFILCKDRNSVAL